MGLDILTPKGEETLRDEEKAVAILLKNFPSVKFIHTPKTETSAVDGLLEKENILYGVVETKCRDLTFDKFAEYNMEWLVTFDKILKGREVADLLQVPFWGMLYLVPERTVLFQKIYHPKSGWCVPFHTRKTQTQATVNGGMAHRVNAYIKMTDSTILR